MNLAVIGTGYVGLTTAVTFAELGHNVFAVDIDEKKVAMLKNGESPIYEPGLDELLKRGIKEKRLTFTTDLTKALPHVEVVFSAVATPTGENHKADLRAVFTVAKTVAAHAEHDTVFVNKSTVPVGTGEECEKHIAEVLKERGVSINIPVVSNPEFLKEGMAVSDTMMPERIVVGINENEWAQGLMEELYRPITRVGKPLILTNRESAEIVKYASNSFLAMKISFINMLTELCEKTGGNIRDVAKGMGLDSRIGPRFLHAGIGYGGSCFPKDVEALISTAKEYDLDFALIEATHQINKRQRKRFTDLILSKLPANAHVGVWGLSFKPKTDDMRDAPSIDIIHALIDAGHTVTAYDPFAMENAKPLLPQTVSYSENILDTAKDADALLVLTEWDIFRGVDLEELQSAMKGDALFDGRNIYDPKEVEQAKLHYYGIGIGTLEHKVSAKVGA